MTREDQKMMFTALAFLAVVQKGEKPGTRETVEQVKQLSELIEEFCLEHAGT